MKLYNISIPKNCNPISIELINENYVEYSIKPSTRVKRGEESKRVYVNSCKQKMLGDKDWKIFFNNISNKQDIISQAVKFFTNPERKEKLTVPLITNNGDETFCCRRDDTEFLFNCYSVKRH